MQSSPSTSDRLGSPQHAFVSQHSPQRGISSSSPLSVSHDDPSMIRQQQQNIPISRDTTPVAVSKPSTPPSALHSKAVTPPSAAASSVASSISLGSVLSPTQPPFHKRLIDSPIDLHELSISSSGSSAEGRIVDVADGANSAPVMQEGLTVAPNVLAVNSAHYPFATSPSASVASPTMSSSTAEDTFRTPNVYINGLPPNFPEDQLHAMTREFGEVISVRTFTRHVSDKPSGYGFVLFASVDAAEKCIETLRKYRNLHPSFSKQVHKIPGTVYATVGATSPTTTDPPDSFKSKMERLKDPGSTNLYMEGLPLSIDEASLAALVTPYRIMSSRLFQTRLSNPPRIIAFVRLESRTAAEEVIERLHGRMVRGWNDPGSRISVRFADTAEQRELRRTERVPRDGENSPARLTMAQAALLNLKGTQLHPGAPSPRIPSPNFGLSPPMHANLNLTPELATRALPPPIGLHHDGRDQAIDVQNLASTFRNISLQPQQQYDGFNAQAADFTSAGLRMPPHLLATDPAISHEMLQMAMGIGSTAATRAHNGFTPMEQLLLQAHTRRQQQEVPVQVQAQVQAQALNRPELARHVNRQSEFNVSAMEFNPSASTLTRLQNVANASSAPASTTLMNYLPAMSEEDFHAGARGNEQMLTLDAMTSPVIAPPKSDRSTARLTLDEASRASFTRQRNLTHAEARAQAQAEAVHTRSTTLPSRYLSTERANIQSSVRMKDQQSTQTNNTASNINGLASINLNGQYNINTSSNNSNNTLLRTGSGNTVASATAVKGAKEAAAPRDTAPVRVTDVKGAIPARLAPNGRSKGDGQHSRIDTAVNGRSLAPPRHGNHNEHDEEEEGSGLDSPALSYSARSSASLSPATPFSAFGETFEGPPMTVTTGVNVAAPGNEVGLGVLAGIQQKTQRATPAAATTQTHATN